MNYEKKLKTDRYRQSSVEGRNFNEEMESDRGRAINSAAVRRLQQKTQVFPLESNAAVRSRLTHSLEVKQVGRYISKIILKEIEEIDKTYDLKLDGLQEGFISAVEIACLLHDIGNPPFGHFGEEAINLWSRSFLTKVFHERFDGLDSLDDILRDLNNFEGNAQGLRILHNLQSLNLTYSQIACVIKYTRGAWEEKPDEGSFFSYRKKKPGYYLSEKTLIDRINLNLSINDGCRFPLTYIMEAADDISYCIADLDDAVDKGILSIEKLNHEIEKSWNILREEKELSGSDYLLRISRDAYKKYLTEEHDKSHAYMLKLRTELVNDLARYAAKRYIENHESIFNGLLDESLLDGSDEYNLATETLRKIAKENVFSYPEVENLELKGYSVISGLLKIYSPIVDLDFKKFKELSTKNHLKSHPIETRLYHKLSKKHKATYHKHVKEILSIENPHASDMATELYYRSRLIIDYISGMTDHFALEEYQQLSASF